MNNAELNLIIGLAEKASGPLKKIATAQEASAVMAKAEVIVKAAEKGIADPDTALP